MKNRILAMPAAAPATAPKPRIPAMMAITRKTTVQYNILPPLHMLPPGNNSSLFILSTSGKECNSKSQETGSKMVVARSDPDGATRHSPQSSNQDGDPANVRESGTLVLEEFFLRRCCGYLEIGNL